MGLCLEICTDFLAPRKIMNIDSCNKFHPAFNFRRLQNTYFEILLKTNKHVISIEEPVGKLSLKL